MSGSCSKCKTAVIYKEPKKTGEVFGYPCDHCKNVVCQTCCEISATEIRTILLSKRSMPFYCKQCLSSVKQLLGLIDRVSILENEIGLLKVECSKLPTVINELEDLKAKVHDLSIMDVQQKFVTNGDGAEGVASNSRYSNHDDDIWTEINDRYSRASNIMLYNVPETGDDEREVSSVLSRLCTAPQPAVHFARVGKRNAKGARAIKVTLNSVDEAKTVLRNRGKLKGTNVYINMDLTPKQRKLEKSVLSEFKNRKSKGEKVQLKYRGGAPCIVGSPEN